MTDLDKFIKFFLYLKWKRIRVVHFFYIMFNEYLKNSNLFKNFCFIPKVIFCDIKFNKHTYRCSFKFIKENYYIFCYLQTTRWPQGEVCIVALALTHMTHCNRVMHHSKNFKYPFNIIRKKNLFSDVKLGKNNDVLRWYICLVDKWLIFLRDFQSFLYKTSLYGTNFSKMVLSFSLKCVWNLRKRLLVLRIFKTVF